MKGTLVRRWPWLALALLLALVPPAVRAVQREPGDDGAPVQKADGRRPAREEPQVLTRWYDVRDLLIDVPDFTDAPVFEPRDWAGHGLAVFGGNVCFPDPYPYDDYEDEGMTREELIEEIATLLKETIDPDSWRDNGGAHGAVRERAGHLVITQTPANHAKVAEALAQERERQSQTVRVRAHWVLARHADLVKLLAPADAGGGGGIRGGGGAAAPPSPIRTVDPAALDALPADTVHYRAETLCLDGQRVFIVSTRHGPAWPLQRAPAVPAVEPTTRPADAAAATRAYPTPPDRTFDAGAVLDFAVTTSPEAGTAVLTLRSQIVEADPPFGPPGDARAAAGGGEGDRANPATNPTTPAPRRLNEIRTSARVPLGKMVLVGGMTADPNARVPDAPQLSLFIEVTTE